MIFDEENGKYTTPKYHLNGEIVFGRVEYFDLDSPTFSAVIFEGDFNIVAEACFYSDVPKMAIDWIGFMLKDAELVEKETKQNV